MINLESARDVIKEVSKQKEALILEQLNEFVKRGLIAVEQGEAMLVQTPHGDIELKQMIRLKLKDQEYIQELETENADLKERLRLIKERTTDI